MTIILVMTFQDWIPAITSSGLLGGAAAAVVWFGRNLITARFSSKLEALKAELRQSEERLKADLRAKGAEIEALRSGAMSAMATRQMAVDKRCLEAVDQLWSGVTALAPARYISSLMAVFKFEEAAKRAESDSKLRELFEVMGGGFDPKALAKALDLSGASKARPFVSPMAWATYRAFSTICTQAVMRWNMLRSGIGPQEFTDNEAINNLIKSVLPSHEKYIDEYGPAGYHYLLETLETKLLEELQAMLAGVEADKAGIGRAAEILKHSDEVMKQIAGPPDALAAGATPST